MLDVQTWQGNYGENYVRALGSAAGLIISEFKPDRDGVDLGLRWPGLAGAAASPCIDVQVKSWSRPRKSGGVFQFNGLNELQFNQLAGGNYTVPRYLFLIVVPPETDSYAEVGADGMLLRYQGFYTSLQQEARISEPDGGRRRTVAVPVGNVLTARALRALVQGTASGGPTP